MEGAALAALREATEPAKRALDELPVPRRVMSRDVTLADYRCFLQAQHAVIGPWSESYPTRLRRACRCDPASRLEALHLDLAVLGDAVLVDAPAGRLRFEWPIDSPAWWGALYVFEGPRLDARAVARHLRQQLGVCVGGALRFLDPLNEAAQQPAWSSIAQSLERAVTTSRVPLAIEGALQTLGYFASAFGRVDTAIDESAVAAA